MRPNVFFSALLSLTLLNIPGAARADDLSAFLKAAAETDVAKIGPQAAMDKYEESAKNGGKPLKISDCPGIIPLQKGESKKEFEARRADVAKLDPKMAETLVPAPPLWTRKQLSEDFERRKKAMLASDDPAVRARGAQLKGIIVMLKTEYCCSGSRLCAASTAVLDRRADPSLDHFLVYGHRINPDVAKMEAGIDSDNPATIRKGILGLERYGSRNQSEREWEKELIKRYGFVQGPGARWLAFAPGSVHTYGTDAFHLSLSDEDFRAAYKDARRDDEKARPVEKWATSVLKKIDAESEKAGAPGS